MKRLTSWLLVLAMLCTFVPFSSASAAEGLLYIPTDTQSIGEEAFAGNTGFTTALISENVREIGPKAFAGCTGLTEVFFDVKDDVEIANDAFEGCGDIHFIVYPDTSAELFAIAHGYLCDRAVPGSSFYERITELVADHGGTSALQGDFDSMRLIVRSSSNRLPDISAYNPTEIVRRGDVFVIQFESEADTRGCYGLIFNDMKDHGTADDFVEVDCCVTANFSWDQDEITAAGVIDPSGWGTDDPMGFDVYAPYIAENSSGGRTIAVIDSGVEIDSSYANKLNYGAAINLVDDGQNWSDDRKGHGSYIASVINECVGDANVSILPIRVVGNGSTYNSGNLDYVLLGNAILYAMECGVDIINLSMCFSRSAYVEMCINEAVQAGITVVVSAGNAGTEIAANSFPANLAQVVTVAGLQSDGTIAGNYGSMVDYVAPYSLFNTARGVNRGTSFSAPMLSAAFALVLMDPYHGIEDMNASCINGNETGSSSNSYGYGMPQLNQLASVPLQAITLSSSMPGELTVGNALELSWQTVPENATNKTVSVSSSDSSVLAIDNREDGSVFLQPLEQGVATVTVTPNSNSNLSVSRTFTVVQPVSSIALQGAKERLAIGRTMRLTPIIQPDNATTTTVEWFSTDTSVATVDQDGTVRGIREGTAGVYVRAKDGYGAQSGTVSFSVIPIPDAEGLTLTINGQDVTDGSIAMIPGETVQIQSSIIPADADQSVAYRSYGKNITVSSTGTITAVSSGTGFVDVYSTDNPDISSTIEVFVRVLPASIQISGATTLNEGETSTLTATILPETADDKTVSWRSSDTNVATVSSGGIVTGKKNGTAQIIATANGDQSVLAAVTVTVRHPFVINLNGNTPEPNVLAPALSATSMSAFSGYALGTMPTALCDYYDFLGWYTQPSGGTRMTEASVIDTADASVTLYAQWRIHEESAWALTSAVPSGARITQTSYSYRESTESTSSSMAGWIGSGDYWKQTGTGSSYYASFPSTYKTSDQYYTNYMKEPYASYDNGSTKREVSNVQEGWIYWHWMYNVAYANSTGRMISLKKGTYNNWAYSYFHAMASNTDCSKYTGDTGYYGGTAARYNARSVILDMTTSAQREKGTSGIGTNLYFRFNRMKSTYTDYQKIYKYYRDLNYQTADPGSGSNGITVSNKTVYVKYRVK